MTDKMTMLYVAQTGHALAALTRSAEPTADLSADELAAGGLLVRGFQTGPPQIVVPAEELKALVVDFNEVALEQPRAFFVDETQKTAVDIPAGTAPTATLTRTSLTLSLAAAAATEVKVWALISGQHINTPRVVKGSIAGSQTSVDLQIEALENGNYQLYALASGLPPLAEIKNIA